MLYFSFHTLGEIPAWFPIGFPLILPLRYGRFVLEFTSLAHIRIVDIWFIFDDFLFSQSRYLKYTRLYKSRSVECANDLRGNTKKINLFSMESFTRLEKNYYKYIYIWLLPAIRIHRIAKNTVKSGNYYKFSLRRNFSSGRC